jgi:DNA polymerase-1
VLKAEVQIQDQCDAAKVTLQGSELNTTMELLRTRKWEDDFESRVTKAKNPEKIKPKELESFPLEFNPNSGAQIQVLVYEILGLPVSTLTKGKQPATGGKVLEKLYKLSTDDNVQRILRGLIDYALGAKILSAFIPAFKAAPLASDGCHYVFGSFKLGGTVSGRISAKNPNLQTIPSGSHFAKIIKQCFIAPPGYIMVGSDFNGLEDFINTVLTKDPNKVKVLRDGYDGHSFRAAYYWKDKFDFIDMDSPESVLRIKHEYGTWRKNSKPVSFALQYQGTWSTLVKNCGFMESEAKAIESNYHELYKVSMDWVTNRIEQATKDGYAIGAFGLKIRTPVLAQVIMGNKYTPQEAQGEARTLGNALSGQSYSLLNNTSSTRFMKLARAHPDYRLLIRLCAHIHDAQYMYIKDDFALLTWVNKHLIEAMAWQDLPELQCEGLRIGSELDVFYPTWADDFTILNGMSQGEIINICATEVNKRREA